MRILSKEAVHSFNDLIKSAGGSREPQQAKRSGLGSLCMWQGQSVNSKKETSPRSEEATKNEGGNSLVQNQGVLTGVGFALLKLGQYERFNSCNTNKQGRGSQSVRIVPHV